MIALVEVNYGRWVVPCPNDLCSWVYQAISPLGRPRYLHTCCGDDNGPGCGTRLELVWPALDEAEQITDALSRRNLIVNRNWKQTESVDALMRENDQNLVSRDLKWLVDNGLGGVE